MFITSMPWHCETGWLRTWRFASLFIALYFILMPRTVFAQTTFSTPIGGQVSGTVPLCVNTSVQAVVPSVNCPLEVAIAGAFASSAAVSSYADGWSVTTGTKADSAWALTGAGSEIAIEKEIALLLAAPLPAGTNNIGTVQLGATGLGGSSGNPLYVSGGGGGGGGTVTQGSNGSASTAWYDQIVLGGTAVSLGNAFPIQPGTGAVFSSSAAAGAYADGWSVTEGTKADTAYAGSGSASEVGILKGLYAALVAPLPAGTNNIGVVSVVGQRPFTATVTITRPANTTAYTAGQVLSSATTGLTAFPTFALGIGNSQKVVINNVSVFSNNGSASTKGQFAVYLFNTASPSGGGFNDASTFAPTAAALSTNGNDLVGVVPSSFPFVGTAAYGYILTNDTRQATTDSSGNLYLAVVLANAYTPASAENITVTISGLY